MAAMALKRLLIGVGTVAADRNGCPAVALGWRRKPDAAIAVPVVVGVVVAHPRLGERSEHTQPLQPDLQRGGPQLFEKPAARRCRCRQGGSARWDIPC